MCRLMQYYQDSVLVLCVTVTRLLKLGLMLARQLYTTAQKWGEAVMWCDFVKGEKTERAKARKIWQTDICNRGK